MARDTIYTFYSTGRADPTYTNIWAFQSSTERTAFFNGKPHLRFTGQKYWRTGATVKIPIKYETALQYDYAIIDNDTTDAQNAMRWYCFIDAKAYVSPNVTLITLSVDWVQTYYFLSGVPFWQYTGFITRATNHSLPPDGTPSDYPVPQTRCVSFTQETGDYAVVMYSSISPASAIAGDLEYYCANIDGVFMSSPPYILKGSTPSALLSTLLTTINGFNTNGMTDAIVGMYLIPVTYLPSNMQTDVWVGAWNVTLPTRTLTFNQPSSAVEYADILTQYGYANLIVNNGQGETESYSFNEFNNGTAQFQLVAALTGGSPTLFCKPVNLKYNNADANERIIKITQAPAIGWLNDSYKIWLAQTQNSRAASIAGAELAISQAEEARRNSWAYKYGSTIKELEQRITPAIGEFTDKLADSIGNIGVTPISGNRTMLNGETKRITAYSFGLARGESVYGMTPDTGADTTVSQVADMTGLKQALNAMRGIGFSYLNNQLGIETTYVYDHAVATAQQQLNQLLASYTDKARIPATARGSNAYGDLARFDQYGFMFATFAPSTDSMGLLNNMIASGGHTVNRYQAIVKTHAVFDYFQANSVKIPANPAARPQFVRKMMLGLLQSGVYLWHYNNGDISQYIGSPYGIDNEYLEG